MKINMHVYQSSSKVNDRLVSNWMLMSGQPHRLNSGRRESGVTGGWKAGGGGRVMNGTSEQV